MASAATKPESMPPGEKHAEPAHPATGAPGEGGKTGTPAAAPLRSSSATAFRLSNWENGSTSRSFPSFEDWQAFRHTLADAIEALR